MSRNAVECMTAADLLFDAARLLADRDVLPAAVLVRAAVETHLRRRLAELGLQPRRPSMFDRLKSLKQAGAITADQAREIRRWVATGNQAAHNWAVPPCDVAEALAGAAQLVEEE